MDFQQGSFSSLLKDGVKHLSEKDQVVVKNIEAVKNLANVTRTSMGPSGLNKLIVNHLGKLFISHDSATIMNELEVIHPAAKVVVLASQSQEKEVGDGTNFVISFAAELLTQAEQLLLMGLHTSDIIQGYAVAKDQVLEFMKGKDLIAKEVKDFHSIEEIKKAMYSSVCAKQLNYVNTLVPLIAEACQIACPKDPKKFGVDDVRVCKVTGGGIDDSRVIKGFALKGKVSSTTKHIKNAKVAVFGVSIESINTETSGKWLIENSVDLLRGRKNEERLMKEEIDKLARAGVNVIITNGSFGDLATQFIEEHKMMAIKCGSKFEMMRICRAIGATQVTKMGVPEEEELGTCTSVDEFEISGKKVVIFEQKYADDTKIATLLLRGATDNILNEIAKSVDDGVNVFKTLTKDPRLVYGAGAFEMEIAKKLTSFAEEVKGLDQYSVRKFAESFLVIPKTLAECSGHKATDVITQLRVEHQEGKKSVGIDVFDSEGQDTEKNGVYDCFYAKLWGIRLATQAAIDILSVDQLIMSRPSGGPKPRSSDGKDWDTDDPPNMPK